MALTYVKKNMFNIKEKILETSKLLTELNLEYNFYKNFFIEILNLEIYDKIGTIPEKNKFGFKLYLDKYNIYQSISRWYYNQKREDIFQKLDSLFQEYNNFISLLNDSYKEINDIFEFLYNTTIDLNKNIIQKLELLKLTYNDMNITLKIDNYIKICKIPD